MTDAPWHPASGAPVAKWVLTRTAGVECRAMMVRQADGTQTWLAHDGRNTRVDQFVAPDEWREG